MHVKDKYSKYRKKAINNMVLNGKIVIKYFIDKDLKETIIKVKLQKIKGQQKKNQNVWEGKAYINDVEYEHPDLPYIVNAQFMAKKIGDEWVEKMKRENSKFKLKNEIKNIRKNKIRKK